MRGRDAYSRRWIFALLSAVPAVVWLVSVGDIGMYFTHHLPAGQLLYLFSKLFGLYAYFVMTVQIILGIQGSGSPYFKFHPRIGMLTTLAVVTHAALFIIAASLRSGHPAFDNLVPVFDQGFYKRSVSLGVIGAYCLVLVIAAAIFMQRFRKLFIVIHRFAFVVAGLGWLHSFAIGTETRIPVVMTFYGCLLAWAVYHLIHKIFCRSQLA